MNQTAPAPPRTLGTRCCPGPDDRPLTEVETRRAAAGLGLLAHPIRLTLLTILCRRGGEVCVCDLEAAVPVKQPTVSHHLRLLREAGLVQVDRRGQWAHYRIVPTAMEEVRSDLGLVTAALRPQKERRR